jgi:hypothetical protein
MPLQPFVGPWTIFQFLNLHKIGRTPWTGDQPIARPLPAHRTTQTQNKRTQISMPRLGFELMIPVFERAKTVQLIYFEYFPVVFVFSNNNKYSGIEL